jgi:Fur family ferric uptake transcriptional regulator
MSATIQIRKTRQKEAIREAFLEADRPLSPEEVLSLAQKQAETVSIATVYRNIKGLVEEDWLVPIDIPGYPTRYEVSGKAHHHHFQCSDCGAVYDLEGCSIPGKPKLPPGFKYNHHEFFVYGSCADCR